MTKRILALLLAALCLLLAACGKQETAAATDGNGLGEKAEFVKEDYDLDWDKRLDENLQWKNKGDVE